MRLTTVVVAAAVVAGCTAGAPSPPTTVATTTTTTTTAAPTTTTAPPPEGVTVTSDGTVPDAGALAVLDAFYDHLVDPSSPPPPATPGVIPVLDEPIRRPAEIVASGNWVFVDDETMLTVAHGRAEGIDDVILLVGDPEGWRVVGAVLDGRAPWLGPEPAMVVVIGSDARVGQDQLRHRADSVHVLTALPSLGRGAILGFPRDSWVETPYGEMKLNAVMAGRGPEAVADEMRDHFGIPVEGYVVTGFQGFEELMWELGPLPIDIPIPIPTQKYWEGWPAGPQELSPQRVLEFARTRKKIPNGDFTRSLHQGIIVLAVLRLLQEGSIDDAGALVATLTRHAWTDLEVDRLFQLAAAAYLLDPDDIANEVVPGRLGRVDGASVVFLSPEADELVADLVDDGLLSER